MQQSCYVNDITSIDGSRTKFLFFGLRQIIYRATDYRKACHPA